MRFASTIGRILKGAAPGDIPVELPSPFDVGIAMNVAMAMGLKFLQPVRLQATEVMA